MAWPQTRDRALAQRDDLPPFGPSEVRLLTFPTVAARDVPEALAQHHARIAERLGSLRTDAALPAGTLVLTAEMATAVAGWQDPAHAADFAGSSAALHELAATVARERGVTIALGTVRFAPRDVAGYALVGRSGALTTEEQTRRAAWNTVLLAEPQGARFHDKFAPYWGTRSDHALGHLENFEFQLAGRGGLLTWPLPGGGHAVLLNCHEQKAAVTVREASLRHSFARVRAIAAARSARHSWRLHEIDASEQQMVSAWRAFHDQTWLRDLRAVFHVMNFTAPNYLWSDWARFAAALPPGHSIRLFVVNQQVRAGLRISGQYELRSDRPFVGYRDRRDHEVPLERRYRAA